MDLVVGAPHFFERKEEIGGAAYVYINPAGHWDAAAPLRLNGTRGSMFGIALGAAGDLNQDGFEDLAVGAPFDGAGKVYIYHGSNLGIVAKPAQVLDGEGVGVTAFGYALSGGLDVDGNLYPDLLVGSLSDTVVLYRARPVVHVSRNVSLVPPNIDLEQSNCQHQEGVCVDVRACFSYTASPASYSPPLVLEYVFDADTERRRLGHAPRVAFLGRRPSDPEHQFSHTVELPRQHARACVKATFQLQDSIRDKLRPIAVTLAYGIQGAGATRHSRGAALPPLSPVLSPQQPSSQRTEVHFLKQGCGDDKICQSNLQLHFQFCARLGDADFVPLPRGEDGTAIFAMSDQKDVALEIHVTNLPSDPAEPQRDGDDAHEAVLTATFPEELPYSAVRPYDGRAPSDKPVVCLANQNGSQVECELGNPLKRGAQVRFYLILSTLGITLQTTDLAVELALSTISEQPGLEPVVARARVVIELPLSGDRGEWQRGGVAVPPRLFFGGVVRGESAVRRESQVGSAVRFEVTVSNRGQSLKTLGSAFLTLQWPHEISNGKWLLYPLQLELAAAPGPRASCSPAANPLLEPPGDTELAEAPAAGSWRVPAPAERKKNVTLDCAQGTARCLAFRCPLHSFERAAVLTARGRLWNSTFLEEFLAVTSVELIVRASVSVTSSIKNLVLKDASTQIPVTIYLDPGVAVAGGVPWWVILLAVLAGILVLALLVFILWKLGFFRRARYAPPAVPQYHAVKIPREERQQYREEKMGTIQRKEWAVNWSEASDGHVTPSSGVALGLPTPAGGRGTRSPPRPCWPCPKKGPSGNAWGHARVCASSSPASARHTQELLAVGQGPRGRLRCRLSLDPRGMACPQGDSSALQGWPHPVRGWLVPRGWLIPRGMARPQGAGLSPEGWLIPGGWRVPRGLACPQGMAHPQGLACPQGAASSPGPLSPLGPAGPLSAPSYEAAPAPGACPAPSVARCPPINGAAPPDPAPCRPFEPPPGSPRRGSGVPGPSRERGAAGGVPGCEGGAAPPCWGRLWWAPP
nr:LOW QUALITY PROTEIN: integrin alpha-7 [Anas platyrhynchos]